MIVISPTIDLLEKATLRIDRVEEFCRALNDTANCKSLEETDADALNRLGVLFEILEDEIKSLHEEIEHIINVEMKERRKERHVATGEESLSDGTLLSTEQATESRERK